MLNAAFRPQAIPYGVVVSPSCCYANFVKSGQFAQ
jgi:hypothetical protein